MLNIWCLWSCVMRSANCEIPKVASEPRFPGISFFDPPSSLLFGGEILVGFVPPPSRLTIDSVWMTFFSLLCFSPFLTQNPPRKWEEFQLMCVLISQRINLQLQDFLIDRVLSIATVKLSEHTNAFPSCLVGYWKCVATFSYTWGQ